MSALGASARTVGRNADKAPPVGWLTPSAEACWQGFRDKHPERQAGDPHESRVHPETDSSKVAQQRVRRPLLGEAVTGVVHSSVRGGAKAPTSGCGGWRGKMLEGP